MDQMHWCSCTLNVAGQGLAINEYSEHTPKSWPEITVLSAMHGEENVFNIKPARISETTPRREKDRLIAKYGHKIVEAAFPGKNFRMEMLMPGETTDQRRVDDNGDAVNEVSADASSDGPPPADQMPSTNAVFKPGRHRPGMGA